MKAPSFENCQVAINHNGKILEASDSFCIWVGSSHNDIRNQFFRELMISLENSWGKLIVTDFYLRPLEIYLPLSPDESKSSLGVFLVYCRYKTMGIISLSPALAPHDKLKNAFMGDLMKDPRALANTLIRLQKAESRLADYISHFPGIFFTQRPDMSFSYLSKGIKVVFPLDHHELSRNGGLFLEKILEQDREHFEHEIKRYASSNETFSFTYRIVSSPNDHIIYMLDIRTPIITATNKLIGYDGVLIDITRQAIAEHRLSNSVWREGLTTLTNGLVHDFSNLMAGIYSISELYHGMITKDDPMANGLGQIKKSAMQAQKLVRRIIDLHRDKPAVRATHDLRVLIKDQMDLVGILIPKSAKITTDFGKEEVPVFLEETGFRQVILNLIINARDAISKNGKIKIQLKKVYAGEKIMKGAFNSLEKAPTDGAEILIKDNGVGMPSEIFDKIFDPFFTTKNSASGSGFGLYNCKIFMEDHRGKISFSSKQGKGTNFYLYLPLSIQ